MEIVELDKIYLVVLRLLDHCQHITDLVDKCKPLLDCLLSPSPESLMTYDQVWVPYHKNLSGKDNGG